MQINNLADKMQEECGIFGLFSRGQHDLSAISLQALRALQHRGQES